MGDIVLEAIGISKQFRRKPVLKDVSVQLEGGKVYGLIGKNGSGKTVFLKIVCGLSRPDSGVMIVEGKRIGTDVEIPPSVGAIIDRPGFLDNITGFRNLQYLARLSGSKVTDEKIRQLMQRLELDPDNRTKVGEYSLGMRQRLAIVQAIMEDPQLIILDEPMNGLDIHGVALMRDIIQSLHHRGKTIIITSHHIEDISGLCDSVYEMKDGVLEERPCCRTTAGCCE